jgi:RNA polymerase sigma-70 factor (ECF subfamily)
LYRTFFDAAHYDRVASAPKNRLSLVRPDAAPACDEDLPGPRTDDDLMLLARGGVEAAFDALVRRHQKRVLGVAARLAGRSSLAPDIAQNTFLAIYRALPKYQPRGKFAAYLYRVLLTQCRLSHRSTNVENHALEKFSRIPTDTSNVEAEDIILARERRREVELALDRLSPKLRQVVVLRYSGDLSYDEIAEVLSIPVGTVKRRIFDAVEKLRRNVEGA